MERLFDTFSVANRASTPGGENCGHSMMPFAISAIRTMTDYAMPHGLRRGCARRWHASVVALLLACPALTAAQGATPRATDLPNTLPQNAPVLGAHTLLAHSEGEGVSPAITAPIETQPAGSTFIVLNGGYAKNGNAPVDNYANRWKRVGSRVVFNGYGGAFDVTAYVAVAGKGGSAHSVRIDKSGYPEGEITVPFIEVRNAGVLKDMAQNYPAPALVMTSGEVTTTGPATLVAVWWGDGGVKTMTTRPDSGFQMIDSYLLLPDNSGVQCAVAYKQVASAGTYHVSWVGSPMQGAILWLFAFQAE